MRRTFPALLGAVALIGLGCGEDDPEPTTTTAERPTVEQEPKQPRRGGAGDRPDDEVGRAAERATPEPPPEDELSAAERAAAATVRGYVRALDRRDGAALCAGIDAEALDELKLPRKRGSCAGSVRASLGYRDPRGLPVWESSRLLGIVSVQGDEQSARVVATVLSNFSDREQPSIEDDVVYLVRQGETWVVAKPSAIFYRAIGAEAPPTVLTPP